ncbi:MAG: N-acetylmuramic acid 6-phosphate etherase [Candidatus Omnitrophica bacterium]|nr:N-acetylmuramic acid 6-phosphate etherase [Candidatus Omnitrophota bacterium]
MTEQSNPRSKKIDRISVEKILHLFDEEEKYVSKALTQAGKTMACAVRLMVNSLKKKGRIFLAGAGTSGRLGVLEAAECPPTFNTPRSMIQAVMAGGKQAVFQSREGAEDNGQNARKFFARKLKPNDLVIGIAASGVTPFVSEALKTARLKKCKTVFITCNPSKELQKTADVLIVLTTGPELISGSTRLKAGTATKLALNRLTVACMVQMGKVYENWMVDVQPKSNKLRARAIRLISHLGRVDPKKAAHYLEKSKRNVKCAIVMARTGMNYSEASRTLKKHSGFLAPILKA